MELKIIAKIYTAFKEKFGIPRQSGLVGTVGKIVFEKEYRRPEALIGLSGYSHIWLLWEFSEAKREKWSPTVRPPRLGGNKKVGVFATRSPYRPNPIGLSSVELLKIERTENEGDILIVKGVDIVNGTPIYDIKPYLKYTDSHEDAVGGFSDEVFGYELNVNIPESLLMKIDAEERENLLGVLKNDPRPSYIQNDEREYGMSFLQYEIFFKVADSTLTVIDIKERL